MPSIMAKKERIPPDRDAIRDGVCRQHHRSQSLTGIPTTLHAQQLQVDALYTRDLCLKDLSNIKNIHRQDAVTADLLLLSTSANIKSKSSRLLEFNHGRAKGVADGANYYFRPLTAGLPTEFRDNHGVFESEFPNATFDLRGSVNPIPSDRNYSKRQAKDKKTTPLPTILQNALRMSSLSIELSILTQEDFKDKFSASLELQNRHRRLSTNTKEPTLLPATNILPANAGAIIAKSLLKQYAATSDALSSQISQLATESLPRHKNQGTKEATAHGRQASSSQVKEAIIKLEDPPTHTGGQVKPKKKKAKKPKQQAQQAQDAEENGPDKHDNKVDKHKGKQNRKKTHAKQATEAQDQASSADVSNTPAKAQVQEYPMAGPQEPPLAGYFPPTNFYYNTEAFYKNQPTPINTQQASNDIIPARLPKYEGCISYRPRSQSAQVKSLGYGPGYVDRRGSSQSPAQFQAPKRSNSVYVQPEPDLNESPAPFITTERSSSMYVEHAPHSNQSPAQFQTGQRSGSVYLERELDFSLPPAHFRTAQRSSSVFVEHEPAFNHYQTPFQTVQRSNSMYVDHEQQSVPMPRLPSGAFNGFGEFPGPTVSAAHTMFAGPAMPTGRTVSTSPFVPPPGLHVPRQSSLARTRAPSNGKGGTIQFGSFNNRGDGYEGLTSSAPSENSPPVVNMGSDDTHGAEQAEAKMAAPIGTPQAPSALTRFSGGVIGDMSFGNDVATQEAAEYMSQEHASVTYARSGNAGTVQDAAEGKPQESTTPADMGTDYTDTDKVAAESKPQDTAPLADRGSGNAGFNKAQATRATPAKSAPSQHINPVNVFSNADFPPLATVVARKGATVPALPLRNSSNTHNTTQDPENTPWPSHNHSHSPATPARGRGWADHTPNNFSPGIERGGWGGTPDRHTQNLSDPHQRGNKTASPTRDEDLSMQNMTTTEPGSDNANSTTTHRQQRSFSRGRGNRANFRGGRNKGHFNERNAGESTPGQSNADSGSTEGTTGQHYRGSRGRFHRGNYRGRGWKAQGYARDRGQGNEGNNQEGSGWESTGEGGW